MKYAVLKYKFVAERPAGVPLEWPASARPLPDSATKLALLPNEILLTSEQYMSLKADNQAAYNAWLRLNGVQEQSTEQMIKDRIISAMNFGRDLMAEYGTRNVMAGFTVQQVKTVSAKLANVQAYLLSGSLYAALDEIENHLTVDSLVSSDTIQYFRRKIRSYLGI